MKVERTHKAIGALRVGSGRAAQPRKVNVSQDAHNQESNGSVDEDRSGERGGRSRDDASTGAEPVAPGSLNLTV